MAELLFEMFAQQFGRQLLAFSQRLYWIGRQIAFHGNGKKPTPKHSWLVVVIV
jgi:hypothetical protein